VIPQVIVAFRMPPAGLAPGPEGTLLTRVRSLCARGEALGARLVAWSGTAVALGWDPDSIGEAVLLVSSIREEALALERAWSAGVAEGDVEWLAGDGHRAHLVVGAALVIAMALARVAKPGEVLVDGDVGVLRAGKLSLLGVRSAMEGGHVLRGWPLDLAHPWARGAEENDDAGEPSGGRYVVFPPTERRPSPTAPAAPEPTRVEPTPMPLPAQAAQEPADRAGLVAWRGPSPAGAASEPMVASVRRIAQLEEGADPTEALSALRRARAAAEAGPPAARCRAALALAVALAVAQRPEDALIEALDALARARDTGDAKALAACRALLARLYAAVGRAAEASALLPPDG
jgi:hypothetical protein